ADLVAAVADSRRCGLRPVRLWEEAAAVATADRGAGDDGLPVFCDDRADTGRGGSRDRRCLVVHALARLLDHFAVIRRIREWRGPCWVREASLTRLAPRVIRNRNSL